MRRIFHKALPLVPMEYLADIQSYLEKNAMKGSQQRLDLQPLRKTKERLPKFSRCRVLQSTVKEDIS